MSLGVRATGVQGLFVQSQGDVLHDHRLREHMCPHNS
jgi:hypothetical protein